MTSRTTYNDVITSYVIVHELVSLASCVYVGMHALGGSVVRSLQVHGLAYLLLMMIDDRMNDD